MDKPISYRLENEMKCVTKKNTSVIKTSFNYSGNFFDIRVGSPTKYQSSSIKRLVNLITYIVNKSTFHDLYLHSFGKEPLNNLKFDKSLYYINIFCSNYRLKNRESIEYLPINDSIPNIFNSNGNINISSNSNNTKNVISPYGIKNRISYDESSLESQKNKNSLTFICNNENNLDSEQIDLQNKILKENKMINNLKLESLEKRNFNLPLAHPNVNNNTNTPKFSSTTKNSQYNNILLSPKNSKKYSTITNTLDLNFPKDNFLQNNKLEDFKTKSSKEIDSNYNNILNSPQNLNNNPFSFDRINDNQEDETMNQEKVFENMKIGSPINISFKNIIQNETNKNEILNSVKKNRYINSSFNNNNNEMIKSKDSLGSNNEIKENFIHEVEKNNVKEIANNTREKEKIKISNKEIIDLNKINREHNSKKNDYFTYKNLPFCSKVNICYSQKANENSISSPWNKNNTISNSSHKKKNKFKKYNSISNYKELQEIDTKKIRYDRIKSLSLNKFFSPTLNKEIAFPIKSNSDRRVRKEAIYRTNSFTFQIQKKNKSKIEYNSVKNKDIPLNKTVKTKQFKTNDFRLNAKFKKNFYNKMNHQNEIRNKQSENLDNLNKEEKYIFNNSLSSYGNSQNSFQIKNSKFKKHNFLLLIRLLNEKINNIKRLFFNNFFIFIHNEEKMNKKYAMKIFIKVVKRKLIFYKLDFFNRVSVYLNKENQKNKELTIKENVEIIYPKERTLKKNNSTVNTKFLNLKKNYSFYIEKESKNQGMNRLIFKNNKYI